MEDKPKRQYKKKSKHWTAREKGLWSNHDEKKKSSAQLSLDQLLNEEKEKLQDCYVDHNGVYFDANGEIMQNPFIPLLKFPYGVDKNGRRSGVKNFKDPKYREAVKESQVRFVELYVINDFNLTRTCQALGIAPTTVISWMKHDPVFKRYIRQQESLFYELLRMRMIELALDGNDKLLIHLDNKYTQNQMMANYSNDSAPSIGMAIEYVNAELIEDAEIQEIETTDEA